MALGDRYFEYTKRVYNEFVVYPPLPVQAAAAAPVPPPASRSVRLSAEEEAYEQVEAFRNKLQQEWVEGMEYDKENGNADQNLSRGLLFGLGVIARAIVKPFALAGALLGDLVADIIRIPVDLVRGIINPSADVADPAPYQQEPKNKHEKAPSSHYVPPKDLKVDPLEAQELVGNILQQNQAADAIARRDAEAANQDKPRKKR